VIKLKSSLRYGSGGPRQIGHKGGPVVVGGKAYGNGMSSFTGYRESSHGAIQSQFRIDWDTHAFRQALDKFELNGDRIIKEQLMESGTSAMFEVRDQLEAMAGELKNKSIPATGTRNIYSTVARALKLEEVPGQTDIRVHTGQSLRDAPYGVRSKRTSAGLSHLVALGYGPYQYSDNLPALVQSSVAHYVKHKRVEAESFGMKEAKFHPGMQGMDFMAEIEEKTVKYFKEDIKHQMEQYGQRYGFTVGFGM
tara:strand:- start:81 stop:833 length:753 start_codon:yes stop_codon:yes gene_type:complete